MALGKNVKRDKLIPSSAPKEKKPANVKSEKKATKATKKVASENKKPTIKAKKNQPETFPTPIEQVATVPKGIVSANYLTQEQMDERKRLKAQYDQDILQLKGKSVQLIVFILGGDRYALEIDKVKEIVPTPPVSRIPHAPEYMKGVANIRGSVMVIMDLEEKFELLKPDEIKEKQFTLVIKNDQFKAGIMVSEVPNTLKVQGDIIEGSSGIMSNTVLDETFIKGLIKKEDGMIILLDIIELIKSDEVRVIAQSVQGDD